MKPLRVDPMLCWRWVGLVLLFCGGLLAAAGMSVSISPLHGIVPELSGWLLLLAALMVLAVGAMALGISQQQAQRTRGTLWLQALLARLAELRAPLNAETVRPLGAVLAAMFPQAQGWVLLFRVPGGLVRGELRRRVYLEVVAPVEAGWDASELESCLRGVLEGAEGASSTPGHRWWPGYPGRPSVPGSSRLRRETWIVVRRSASDIGVALAVVAPRGSFPRRERPPQALLWDTALVAILNHLDLLEGHYLEKQAQLGEAGFGLRVRVLVHELSRELQIDLNYLAQAQSQATAEETRDLLTEISAFTARAAHWVHLFRDIPFGDGAIPVAPHKVALAAALEQALGEARRAWPGVYFTWKGAQRAQVLADDHLGSVLRNLLFNAASFSPDGEVCVRVSRAGREVRVVVEDSGPGVTRDQAETIFAAGVALEQPGRARGMGVGLTIAREIARACGGDLICHPKEEGYGGGCFEIRLLDAGKVEETA